MKSETLRSYALIFEKPRRAHPGGPPMGPGEISLTAARCCRLVADAIDRGDKNLPPEWRNPTDERAAPSAAQPRS